LIERRVANAASAAGAQVVVELGPGTGSITCALLAAMTRKARLLAIERTAEFVDRLRGLDDDRIDVVNGCASTIFEKLRDRGMHRPRRHRIRYSVLRPLPEDLARTIGSSVAAALVPGGRFVANEVGATVTGYMNPLLGTPVIDLELLNLPPTRLFTRQQREDGGGVQAPRDRHIPRRDA